MTVHRITDFTPWDLRDQFSDYETAYLWLGFEPNYSNEHPSNVIGLRLAFSEAQSRGELRNQTPSYERTYHDKWGRERGVFIGTTTHYSRHELKRYAERKGQRPLFLFPEDRSAPVSSEAVRTMQSEQGRQGANQQHADRKQWYKQAVNAARNEWGAGSNLRHDEMATHLMEDAPENVFPSRDTLMERLKEELRKMERTDLIRGFAKK